MLVLTFMSNLLSSKIILIRSKLVLYLKFPITFKLTYFFAKILLTKSVLFFQAARYNAVLSCSSLHAF